MQDVEAVEHLAVAAGAGDDDNIDHANNNDMEEIYQIPQISSIF